MVIRMIMAALAAGGCVCAAAAQEAGSRPDLGPDLGRQCLFG